MARRRSRELFPTDAPVEAARLIGRAADVDGLHRDLAAGLHQIVLGPRRTGKTSVCRAALDQLAQDELYVVPLDLFALTGRAELAAAVVAGCIANRGKVARGARKLRSAGRTAAGLASVTLTARLQAELGQDVEIAFTPALAGRDPDRSLEYALALPQRIADADDVQLVLFIDEFQEVAHPRAPYGNADVLTKQMRAALQDSPRVTALFTGSIDHLMADLFTPAHRAFYRFGAQRRLSEITDAEWEDGLTRRFAEDRVTCVPGALELLLERTGGHPRSTMLVAQQAHLALLAAESHRLTRDHVEEGFFAALAADAIGHQTEVERIRQIGPAAIDVARRVARGERPYPPGTAGPAARPTDRALAALRDAGILERPSRGFYVVTDPLLAHYLARL